MAYEQFLETVRERLQALMGPSHTLSLRLVPKNNGVELNGISDSFNGSPMAPTVYLDSYYSLYQQGLMSIDDICLEVLTIFADHPYPGDIRAEDLSDIEKMRPLIMMRLIHYGSNEALLKCVPHLTYLDLAIVFYISLEHSDDSQMTILIHNEHMAKWGLDTEQLMNIALNNTPSAYPAQIHSMIEVLKSLTLSYEDDDFAIEGLSDVFDAGKAPIPLFVLTNSSGVYGAVCMLYRQTLKNFADLIGSDLIIIPSSVHEVLLAPYDEDMDFEALNTMVAEVNRTEVSVEDRLSDHVYRYSRQTDDISIPLSQTPAASL